MMMMEESGFLVISYTLFPIGENIYSPPQYLSLVGKKYPVMVSFFVGMKTHMEFCPPCLLLNKKHSMCL